ncbi:MAG TPA: hypothetical protein DCM51_03360 [Actinobacteria bacterium]|jgi:ribosomal protein L37AE/L43A|nr:hypothetical protein [Actinomycetota bacterium]
MREWTTQELRVLRDYAGLGAIDLAHLLHRSPKAVKLIARRQGISLRRSDDDIPVGRLSAELLARIRANPGLAVCPMCGKRFARIPTTGMCRCCHLDALIDAHQESIEEQIRLRRLDKVRQDKSRMRVCDSCGRPFFPRTSSQSSVCRDCS